MSAAFLVTLGLTLLVWILRGMGVLTFIPGGILWVLLLVSASFGIVASWQSSRRW